MFKRDHLKAAQSAYRRTGNETNWFLPRLQEAHNKERDAGQKLIEAYQAAFKDGFVIKAINDLTKVRFLAGYEVFCSGLDHKLEDKLVQVDEAHARSLSGRIATAVVADINLTARQMANYGTALPEQAQPIVNFWLDGDFNNDPPVDFPRYNRDRTYYTAEIRAIDWRYPTAEEVAALGGSATQQ